MTQLRPYQQRAYEAAIEYLRTDTRPGLIEAATGAGKSHIIASIAQTIHEMSGGKHVLSLAPSKELVEQNRAKFLATGQPASMFSSSAGSKCLRHPVVFATPGTVANAVHRFGSWFAAVQLDEAHRTTPTVRSIVDHMRAQNPRLRVLGLTATPFRLDSGYIYDTDDHGNAVEQAEAPYFHRLVSRVTAQELIHAGYLTPPVVGVSGESYETDNLERTSTGLFKHAPAVEGWGRKTSRIVAEIVDYSRHRNGVLLFAATRNHAREVLASLPPDQSAFIDGTLHKKERERVIRTFLARGFKYLVNVDILTTGFDAAHIDVIALLRKTESASLMQQMIGRGLRLYPGKHDCLVLDYARNLEYHCPDGDLFNPEITAPKKKTNTEIVTAQCPWCASANRFTAAYNAEGYGVNDEGYFTDLDGNPIPVDSGTDSNGNHWMPAHHGRRCTGIDRYGERCGYRWTSRVCDHCGTNNDVTARRCESCGHELIDPNEKLIGEHARALTDPTAEATVSVRAWNVSDTVSKAGNPMYRVTYHTDRGTIVAFYPYASRGQLAQRRWRHFNEQTHTGTVRPNTITCYRDKSTGFWVITNYNQEVSA